MSNTKKIKILLNCISTTFSLKSNKKNYAKFILNFKQIIILKQLKCKKYFLLNNYFIITFLNEIYYKL